MCGSPAVPSTSAIPRLMKSSREVAFVPYFSPGARNASPRPLPAAADRRSAPKSPWKRTITMTVSVIVPPISSTVLTIWIQVVARMPPKET